jgi:hypothetical protein
VEAKMAELGQTSAIPSTSNNDLYRDRAKERRNKYGLDPGQLFVVIGINFWNFRLD